MTDSKTCPCCCREVPLDHSMKGYGRYYCAQCNMWAWKEGDGAWWYTVDVTETKVTTRREVREFKPGGFKVT